MLTHEVKRFIRNWRAYSVRGTLLIDVRRSYWDGFVTWDGRLTPKGADIIATADAIGYDPDAPECDACRDTGSVREWVDVPIMGEWTVTRERVRPCEECSAQAEAGRATIRTGLRSADGARPMRAVDPFPGYEYYSPTAGRIVRGPTDDAVKRDPGGSLGRLSDVLSPDHFDYAMTVDPFAGSASTMVPAMEPCNRWVASVVHGADDDEVAQAIADRDAIERGTLSLADFRERLNAAVLAWHDDVYRSAFVSTATGSDLEPILALALTPEPGVIDWPAPVDWNYLDRKRDDG